MNKLLIGEKLRYLREQNNLSRVELAKIIGSTYSAISLWETGLRVPNDSMKIKLAELYGKSVDEIFYNNGGLLSFDVMWDRYERSKQNG